MLMLFSVMLVSFFLALTALCSDPPSNCTSKVIRGKYKANPTFSFTTHLHRNGLLKAIISQK